ncbi:MAG TPA: EAL domain-containing protein [Caulobacteraceae bacterium]|jgi:diguanylate cyclase (GGDEF)-like protein/PAS domain S-box-containing protein
MHTLSGDFAQTQSRHGEIDDVVYSRQLHQLALRGPDIFAHLVAAAAAVVALGRLYPNGTPILWAGALLAVLTLRSGLQDRYLRAAESPARSRRWGLWFTAGALATGLLWSLIASVFIITNDLGYQVVALALIGGMSIAGIARNAASTEMMIAVVAPMIAATTAALLAHPTSVHVSIVLMLGAFGLVLVTAGRSLHRSVRTDLRHTLELVKTGATLATAQGASRAGSWEVAATGRALWSEEVFDILGVSPAGSTPSVNLLLERVHPADRASVQAAIREWLAGERDLAIEHRVTAADRTTHWVHQFGLIQRDAAGRPLRHTAIVQDITDRKQSEARLQFANVVMKTQMEASEDGIVIVSDERRVISSNERFAQLFEVPSEILKSGDIDALTGYVVPKARKPDEFLRLLRHFDEHRGEDGQHETELIDGRIIHWYTVTLKAPDGGHLGRAWFIRDVTEQTRVLARAVETSRLDQLTGLLNRGAFVEMLRETIGRASAGETKFAVLYLDLDNFKDVNDALGHPAGDELLRAVADRLTASTRACDTAARFGGDEFAVIADNLDDAEEASSRAARLIEALSEPYQVGGVPVRTSSSIGIALYEPGVSDAETLLSRADLALYSAKNQGRSAYRPFTEEMGSEVRTRLALGADLHQAISGGELFLLYQPQIDVASERIVGVEALVRWRHPVRGVLPPSQFIPVAEQTGVIGKLGQWVLSEACRQARAWRNAGAPPVRVSVNVSSLQFKTALAFEADIAAALADNELDADSLELELTETVLMNAYREHADLLLRLRQMGLTIAIDDFGTGYSSLDYLRRFPVDRIKIAQDFVRELETASGDAAIVKATIGLARELNIDVLAEGVERREQLELLETWGCRDVQGYYFARPLPPAEIAALLCSPGSVRADNCRGIALPFASARHDEPLALF